MYSFYDEMLLKMGLVDETVGSKVTICNMRGVKIEGHGGLLLCSDAEISFKFKKKRLYVRGENLVLKEVSPDEIYIFGKISSVGVENE